MKLKAWLQQNWLVVLIAVVFIAALIVNTTKTGEALTTGGKIFLSIVGILTSVYIFIGLFSVWVREEQIMRHFGEGSGAKGLLYGALLGMVFHGPPVSIFPLLKSLREKGARLAVIVSIVSAFAIKLPVIPLELSLFGLRFTVVHNGLLFLTAPFLGLIMEKIIRTGGRKEEG